MQGLMQDYPLTVVGIFDRAEKLFPDKSVITSTATDIVSRSYAEWADRTRRLGTVLSTLGISADGRVGTFG